MQRKNRNIKEGITVKTHCMGGRLMTRAPFRTWIMGSVPVCKQWRSRRCSTCVCTPELHIVPGRAFPPLVGDMELDREKRRKCPLKGIHAI